MADTVRTTCPYCGVGCGVLVTPAGDGTYSVKGDPDHPANFGKLCSKGSALGETLDNDGRLLHPIVDGARADWDTALDRVAHEFKSVIDEHGPDAVAFYVSGQLMTEAYYVANKLMKGFIGSANIDTNSRLCMASSVVGHKRAFGSDTVPGNYEDLDQADMVVLVGSNLAWCHPVLYQRLAQAKKSRGTRVVVIDPRRTATCDIADQHLAVKPGTDIRLFNGLLSHLHAHGMLDDDYVLRHTEGLQDALQSARHDAPDLASVAELCGLNSADIASFYAAFRNTEKVVTIYSQGVNQSAQGSDKVNAILNCHLLTGRIGKPGAGPLSVTGQPNAMGGREVGGLANTLAAHMDFDAASIDRVGRFWSAPNMAQRPGLKAVDMFEAVHDGRIKALWVMATNPAVSLPDADRVRAALAACPFVVVSDCVARTDTTAFADVVLPATTWGERDGTVTNSERRISRQRPFRIAPGEAREDWAIVCDVAARMGHGKAFAYDGPADIFREHAALSAFENDGSRDFDIGGLQGLDTAAYDDLAPVQWPVLVSGEGGQERLFARGDFFTANARARFLAVHAQAPVQALSDAFPLVLNTGRVRDQWHTMTRTGLSPRLAQHRAEPFVEIHPTDAARFALTDGGLAQVRSLWGDVLVRVRVEVGQQLGSVFAPIHWNDTNSANAVVGRLVSPDTDPFSGQPDAKFTPVAINAYAPAWHALLVTRTAVDVTDCAYWTAIAGAGCVVTAMAGNAEIADWETWAMERLGGEDREWLSFSDPKGGRHRFAALKDGQLEAAMFVSPRADLPSLDWVQGQFALDVLDDQGRAGLLAGRAPGETFDPGPMVCSCFSVGVNDLRRAITEGQALSVEAIGELLQAGTNCGSCRPEIQAILDREAPQLEDLDPHQAVA
ncbi:molybdopterin-dependent oxidoreductase [Magnetovibrio sp.]|uniref:molybdopterin-dependent oxidoreductase n=1 Tax=Magnetovibrio sp. TaxID=2024836 RepID=UPI002F94B95E